jgi:hypothetical protein
MYICVKILSFICLNKNKFFFTIGIENKQKLMLIVINITIILVLIILELRWCFKFWNDNNLKLLFVCFRLFESKVVVEIKFILSLSFLFDVVVVAVVVIVEELLL